jgi:hypothetical protein
LLAPDSVKNERSKTIVQAEASMIAVDLCLTTIGNTFDYLSG